MSVCAHGQVTHVLHVLKEPTFKVFSSSICTSKSIKITKWWGCVLHLLLSLAFAPYTSLFTCTFISWLSLFALCIFSLISICSLQMMEHYVSGRTSPTRRTQRWWQRGRASLICCPLPEVSPPPALTVKINALFYYLALTHSATEKYFL